jgi:transmembrane sensor
LEEISRQYNIKVECKESPSNQDFSGTIPMDNLAVALEIITNTYHLKPVDSKINDKKIILESLND